MTTFLLNDDPEDFNESNEYLEYVVKEKIATFEISEKLRTLSEIATSQNKKIIIDLKNCEQCDSTFLGMMTRIAIQQNNQNKKIFVKNGNKDILENIQSLGIHRFFEFTN